MGNMFDLAKQIKKMQEDMAEAQAELAETIFEYSTEDGGVTVQISGHQRVQAIEIKPEMLSGMELATLQEALITAVNGAIELSQMKAAEKLEGLTGGLNLPGL